MKKRKLSKAELEARIKDCQSEIKMYKKDLRSRK